jgi:very-short-patch-repair endonuclease
MTAEPGPTSLSLGDSAGRATLRPVTGNNVVRSVKLLGVRDEVPVSGARDARIALIAGAQRGRVATRQLRAAGISTSAIGRMVASGWLIPAHRGVFLVGHAAPVGLGDETSAVLALGDNAALSHLSAAILWGLLPDSSRDGRIHVVVPAGRRISAAGVAIHRSRILERRDVQIRDGLPVVSPARALLDIAPQASSRQLELAFDRGIVDRVVRPADVADVLQRAGGHRGRKRLATVLARQTEGTTMTRSEAEERVLALIRAARLPRPLCNAKVAGYEVDFFWPKQRLALEVDGFRFHSARGAFERDRRKDNELRKARVTTMRTTWWQVTEDSYALVADLAREVQSASPS